MTNIKQARRPVASRGYVRRVLPILAFVAATMLAGCVYPYPPGPYHYGYYQPHPYYGGGWH
jgi:hypothetical protein